MGMHRDGPSMEFDPIERNTRRQVWWSIYTFEKILCSILGRPTVIDDSEMSMRVPDAPMLEQNSMSAEFMKLALELHQMSYRIRQRAYFDARTAEERSPTIAVATALLRECDEYFSKIPRHLSVEFCSPDPLDQRARVLLLHVYYYYTRCIVSRDFLIQKVESYIAYLENKTPSTLQDWDTTLALSVDCVESAHQSIKCIMAGSDLGMIGYSWLDLFFVFHSVLIVCADFLARPREQQDSSKDIERKEMVRAMLKHVRGMKKLAPTYHILGRIAMQFASMTGVCDDPAMPEEGPGQSHNPSFEPGDDSPSDIMGISDVQEDWFANATTNLGLDFFDLNQSVGGVPLPMHPVQPVQPVQPAGPAYPGYFGSSAAEVDDWTARTLRGMHTV
jgi:proline utilization trans-activator